MYDPWCDQDSDGDIDIYDIVPAAMAYGTTGDSTRNVTVTNWPREPQPKVIVVVENLTVTQPGSGLYFLLVRARIIFKYNLPMVHRQYIHVPYVNDYDPR